jgi:hypothetical protein
VVEQKCGIKAKVHEATTEKVIRNFTIYMLWRAKHAARVRE